MANALQNNCQVSFVYGDVDEGYDVNKKKFRRYGEQVTLEEMLKTYRVPIPQQGSLWRRTVIEQVGGLDPQWNFVLDREFFLRVAQNFEIAYVPGAVAFFRYHAQSKSISTHEKVAWTKEISKMYERFFTQQELSSKLIAIKGQAMGAVYLHCASIALRGGQISSSMSFILKGVRKDPKIFFRRYIYADILKRVKAL